MSEEIIVRHCAPTLAGVKIANMFAYNYSNREHLFRKIAMRNKLLNEKGVYFEVLKAENHKALILVYRKKWLQEILEQRAVQIFLRQYGYESFLITDCLEVLKQHLQLKSFPHEIGVFLGYPLQDIKDFIKYEGKNSKCVGCWKVYRNIEEAQKTFELFKKCTQVYGKKLIQGFEITQLTVVS